MIKTFRLALLIVCFLNGLYTSLQAQKQLIILKGENVLLRLYPGDEIKFSVKGSKKVKESYINNLYDTAVVAHNDVVPFYRLDKIYFKRKNFLSVVGGLLVIGGAGYFIIDQINVAVVQGEGVDIDPDVAITSAAMVGVGLPLMLSKKNFVRIGGKYRLMVVDKGSVFWRPDVRKEMDH